MNRSQPIDINSEFAKKLGLTEEQAETSGLEKEIIKTEIVDSMFDFSDYKPNLIKKALAPFRRANRRLRIFLRSSKISRQWRGLFNEYYSLDIRSFLPMFVHHLERYIALEKKHGMSTQEWKEYKLTTAQEAVDILNRLIANDYDAMYTGMVTQKWGNFPYEKATYSDGSVGLNHLTPEGYDAEMRTAYEQSAAEERRDLKRLGEIVERNMLDWGD